MRLLLDTHILIWMFEDNDKLSQAARNLVFDKDNVLFCSDVSVWEVSLKHFTHPDRGITALEFDELCRESDLHFLSIRKEHIFCSEELEAVHFDPFDRLLLAQAKCECMHLVSHDRYIAQYSSVNVISV